MRFPGKSLIFIAAGMFAAAPAIAQERNATECRRDGTQLELTQCAAAQFGKADAELNRLYKAQMSHLGADAKKRLQAAQRAWIQYRDTTCLYETGPREESGSIWPMEDALCRAKLTKERNAVLGAYVRCRADGCPN